MNDYNMRATQFGNKSEESQHQQTRQPSGAERIQNLYEGYTKASNAYDTIKQKYDNIQTEYDPNFKMSQFATVMIIPSILIIIYYLSPIDLLPDSIPVVGTLDDMAVSYTAMLTVFSGVLYKKTGIKISFADIISIKPIIATAIEHVITSTLQMLSLPIGDILVLPLVCSLIDCAVMLVSFWVTVSKNWPNLAGKLKGYYQHKKQMGNTTH